MVSLQSYGTEMQFRIQYTALALLNPRLFLSHNGWTNAVLGNFLKRGSKLTLEQLEKFK